MAKYDNTDLPRLCKAMERSRRMLKRPRAERREAIRLYAGDHWSEETSQQSQPLNLLSLYVQIMLRNLVPKSPRVMLGTFQGSMKATVATGQQWSNREIEKMKLASALRRWAMDALFSVGIMKVGLATPSEAAATSWGLNAGSPFAKPISLDDFYVDPDARDPDEVSFIGHQYRVPLDTVRDDGKLYTKARKDLQASTNSPFTEDGEEKTKQLGRTYNLGEGEEYEDMVDLVEVYCPRHRLVKTLALDQVIGSLPVGEDDEPLRVQPWLGRDTGPYHWLRFGIVPDNLMPKAPIQDLINLHTDANNVLRKLIRQARRQKSVLPVPGASAEDVERLNITDDGCAFRADNPMALKEVSYGGPSQQNFAIFLQLKEMFDFMGGNLSLLGGRGPQSPTATQDKMLNENASLGVTDMQETMVNGAADVIESLFWYWWHDPFKTMRTTFQLPGLPDMSIPLTATPQQRMLGNWDELDIRVDPYSMQHQTPQGRLAQLNQLVQTVVIPLMPLLEKQGIAFDLHVYLQKAAGYLDNPDVQEIITIREPPMQEVSSGGGEQPGMPAQTERTYNRVSTSEQTDRGSERNLMSTLMGADPGGSPEGNGQL